MQRNKGVIRMQQGLYYVKGQYGLSSLGQKAISSTIK